MKKTEKKKNPNDYPQLIFRVSESDKNWILKEVEKACNELNKKRKNDEKVVRKNQVLVEAIKIGLKKIMS